MEEERFITVTAEIKVTIDKNLIEKTGISEEDVKRFAETRVKSIAHRISAWLTETLLSTLLLIEQQQVRQEKETMPTQTREEETKEYVASIYRENNKFYFKPAIYLEALQRRKYLKIGDKLIPLKLSTKRIVTNPEAITVLQQLMKDKHEIKLVILGRINRKYLVLGVAEDAENTNSSL